HPSIFPQLHHPRDFAAPLAKVERPKRFTRSAGEKNKARKSGFFSPANLPRFFLFHASRETLLASTSVRGGSLGGRWGFCGRGARRRGEWRRGREGCGPESLPS